MSAKSVNSAHRVSKIGRNAVGKRGQVAPAKLDVERLKNNLGQMVDRMKTQKKSKAIPVYEAIAKQLSVLAGLNNGHVWGWRYVASVKSGSTFPSKKFIDTFKLLSEKQDLNKKQYLYFVYRNFFAVFYNKTLRAEIIRSRMRSLNFKEVSYSQYMQVKKRKNQ